MSKEMDFTTNNQHITIWGLLRQHILGKKLIAIIFCLALTSGITFIRPLVVKGITDEGMLKANMAMIADRSILFVVSYILAIIGGILGLLLLNWKLAVVVIAAAPFKAILSVRMANLNERATEDNIRLTRKFSSWFGDVISGLKEIKLWNLQTEKEELLCAQQSEILKTSKKSVLYDSYNRAITSLLDGMVQCVLYIYGGYILICGELTLGGVTAFISYSSYVLGPITSLMTVRYMFSSIKPSLTRLNEFFDLDEGESVCSHTMDQPSSEQSLSDVHVFEVRDLVFSHSKEPLLTGVSFTAHKGEQIAIIGQNGSGKSTLIDLVLRFEKPESGEILIDGINALSFTDEQYWTMFSVVDQEPYFFQNTVRNNVDPKGAHSEAEIQRAFTLSGIMGFFQDRFKGDLNRMVHFDAGNLSGGERKKLAIARAILKDAPILVMDEAAADYDYESEQYLSSIISTQFKDKIVIYITHNYTYLDRFNKVYRIDKGKLHLLTDSEIDFYGDTAEHAKGKALREDSTRQGICRPIQQRCGRTDSSRQAGPPVSQNQIRQREQDIQFGNLFSQTPVPRFPVSKLALYYSKDMLYLGPYGGFLLFAAFDLPAGTIVCVFTLRGPSVDFVTDPFALAIEKNGVFPLFSAQVAAVAIYAVLIAG